MIDEHIGVSIVIPAYNCEKYVEETIRSILKQTYQYFEVIVIDDFSTDNTWSIINSLAKSDNRIRIYHNDKNMGSARTRNKGVELSIFDWIAFIDADDCWVSNKLELQMALINSNHGAKFIFTGSSFIDSDGKRLESVLHVPQKVDFNLEMGQNIISDSSVLIKKQLLIEYPMPHDERVHEDYVTWLRILEKGIVAYGVDKPLLIYRIHSESKSANKLKAAIMHWNSYSYVHCSWFGKIRGMCEYIFLSLKKFSKIK